MPSISQSSTTVPDMDDFNQLAQRVTELEARVTALEESATTPPPNPGETVPSADGSTVNEPGSILVDDSLNEWRLTVDRKVEWMPVGETVWKLAGISYDVKLIEKWQSTCYQCNQSNEWYSWTGTTWVRASDPSMPPTQPGTGAYRVANGAIVDSNGVKFVARGFCLLDQNAHLWVSGPECKPLLDLYPFTNFLHIMPWPWTGYTWPEGLANIVEWATAKGIVCEIGNWVTWPAVETGAGLERECAWYADLARRYMGNDRVWFSTCNEPQDWWIGLPPGSITAEQVAVYNAIRNTGNQTLIGILGTGGTTAAGLTPVEAYLSMTNIHFDAHYYNWLSGGSQDYNTCVHAVHGVANDLQQIKSADGVIPCIYGEWGNATDGAHVDDASGVASQAVLDVSSQYHHGGAAFCAPFWPAAMGGQWNADQMSEESSGGTQLTPYGAQVQSAYAHQAAAVASPAAAPMAAAPAAADAPAEHVEAHSARRADPEQWQKRRQVLVGVQQWKEQQQQQVS